MYEVMVLNKTEGAKKGASALVSSTMNQVTAMKARRETERILIIAGNHGPAGEFAAALNEQGYSVATVRDYPEALLNLARLNPDIVVVEEGHVGYELRSLFDVPVILISTGPDGSKAFQALGGEAGESSATPPDVRGLVARIKKCWEQANGERPRNP